MPLIKISVALTGLLTLVVIVLAFFSYSLSSEVRRMRDDMATQHEAETTQGQEFRKELASLQQTVNSQGQEFGKELASLRKEVEQLATMDELTTFIGPLSTSQGSLVFSVPGSSWIDQEPESVKTIQRSDYGTDWPFPVDEVQIGCHGREVIVTVGRGEFMVDDSPSNLHSFLPGLQDVSIFDPSSAHMDRARERLTEEGRTLCRGMR